MLHRHVVALGGGGFLMERNRSLLDEFVLSLARGAEPRVLYVGTARGDNDANIRSFYQAFNAMPCRPAHLQLFDRAEDIGAIVRAADVVYVGGGNTANLLAIWRLHGVDRLMREAWEGGAVLAGVSAGANCWFEGCSTDSFGGLTALADGLGILEGSCCPHFDGDAERRPSFTRMVREGALPEGLGIDDHAAAHFVGTELVEVVAASPGPRAWRVRKVGDVEPIAARVLGSPTPPP